MNKGYGKKRPRGRPKKRRGKDKVSKLKSKAVNDNEEEKPKTPVVEENPVEMGERTPPSLEIAIQDNDEDDEEMENKEKQESLYPPMSSSEPPTSTSPPEAVVAQLHQLQETVVSHILQYQAGVMAQYQQIQQQMLSELAKSSNPSAQLPVQQMLSEITSSPQPQVAQLLSEIKSPGQPQVTVMPVVKTEPNERKRKASDMSNERGNGSVEDIAFKRKRTAFTEKQYQILETTFIHNNFPEPIDQHCIALRIKTPYRSIKMWFQNRRASVRKRLIKQDQVTEIEKKIKKEVDEEETGTETKNSSAGSHNDSDSRWYCVKCPSTFITKQFLDSHMEAHEKETLYCPDCKVPYTHRVLLDTHKISKCKSKTGIELSHLDEENKSREAIEKHKNKRNNSVSAHSLKLENVNNIQSNPLISKPAVNGTSLLTLQPPPLINPNVLLQVTNLQQNPLFLQQQQLMQQLLLVQLQQAAQKAKQEAEKVESPPALSTPLPLSSPKQLPDLKNQESTNESLTVGGLTIFPVKPSGTEGVKVKEEVVEQAPEESMEEQPSTLQDQITSILHSQGLKTTWKSMGIKEEEESEGKPNTSESMKEQIEAIIRLQENKKKNQKLSTACAQNGEESDYDEYKRHRRRTTVFNEVQLRTLYMHFTHCNFPDPAMFKIIGHLIKLDPQVIKIWFQNERSRQRKRASHIVDEVNSKEKPYKCRDCGMSFAMLTFLVKHSMRHVGETDQDSSVRTCPLCLQKWNKEVFSSHLKSRHNVNLSLVEEKQPDSESNLKCYLCKEKFVDQENLMVHKHQHLKDNYGDPPQCSQCKTTFVNAICLEAHMETHETGEWTVKCSLCGALFHDKILLTSHKMGHGVPLAPVSTIDRSRSQLQHTTVRKTSSVNSLTKSIDDIESVSDTESITLEKPVSYVMPISTSTSAADQSKAMDLFPKSPSSSVSIAQTTVASSLTLSTPTSAVPTFITSSTMTPSLTTSVPALITSRVSPATSTNNGDSTSPAAPVSYVKLIPVQLIPTNTIPSSQAGAKGMNQSPFITTPTTAFISVPVSFMGPSEATVNPLLSQLLDSSGTSKVSDDKNKKREMPNLIPISKAAFTKAGKIDGRTTVTDSPTATENGNETRDGSEIKGTKRLANSEDTSNILKGGDTLNHENKTLSDTNEVLSDTIETRNDASKALNKPRDESTLQSDVKKRYVPILPLMPLTLASANKEPKQELSMPVSMQVPEGITPLRPKSTRNITNKRLWEGTKMDYYQLRRTPVCFSGKQREILEAHFDHDNFPVPGEQIAVAEQLNVDHVVIKTWFQNARSNIRRKLKMNKSKEGVGGPFHCQKCKVSFISDLSLKEHMDVHALNTGICCDVCDINFSHNHVLKTHQIACHSKGDFFKRKNLGEVLNQFLQNKTQCDSNVEDASDSDFDDVSNVEAIRREFADIASSVKSEDSLEDGEDYHPSMAVECILDSSDDEVQNNGEVNEQLGHKCSICRESFASLIALKEHSSLHCINQKLSKPGHFKRRKKTMLYGKSLVGSCIRCIDCQSVFTDRSNYLEHFSSYPCSSVRQRIEYTDEEQKILVTHYDRNNFPLPSDMSLLARRLGVRYRQIMYWFQNRRNKERRRSKEGKRTPPIECQKCKASFVTEENLKRHQDNIHGGETSVSKTEHVCPAIGCEAVFYNSELLVTHSLVHQLGTDALRPDEETVSHRVPKLGTPALWTDFNILEAHYSDNNFPDPMDIGFIARRLKVAPLRVHTWFKERRNQHMKKLEENGQKVMEGSQKTLSIQKFLSKACSKCDAAFLCQTDFDTHMDMHGSSWSLYCNLCRREFSNTIVLETHWIRHGREVTKEKSQSTKRAAKVSFSSYQLQVLETHYENNNFPVALEVWLVALRLKLRPMQVTHWFQNKRGRERRLLKLKTPYSIVCGLCSASFISDIFLKNHIRLHKGNDRYSCSQCSAVFLSPILKETHELYHTNVPNEKAHLAKDPMIEGQVHRGEEATEDNSDVSEGELQIDESEGFKICLEGNEDENVALNKEPIEKQEVSELPDSEYEPYIEEDSIEENITYEETCSEELEMEKKALASYESQHSVLVGNDDKSNDTECVNTDGDDSNRDTYDGIKREDDSNERTIYDSEMKNNHKTADSERGRDQHETNGCHDLERADDIMEREEKDNSSIETESAPNKISEYGVFEVSSITRGTPLHSEKIPKTRIFYELKHDLNVDSNSKKPEPGIFEESVCDIERHIREENEASNSIKPKPGIFEESMYNFRKHIREENDDSNSKKADPGIFEESICDKSKHIREENEDSNSKKPEPGIFVEPVYDVRNLIREENEESNSKKAEPGIFEEPVYDVGKHMREENEESNSNKLEPGIFKESVYDIKKCIREKNEASNSKMPEVDIFEESVYDIRKHIREEYFFEEDDEESDDDDEDEPRLKIVSAYTMCANSGDVALEEDS